MASEKRRGIPPRGIEMREEFLAYGDLPISATITGHRKSPAGAGLSQPKEKAGIARRPNFTAGTRKGKGGREEPK
jgi:hypothetical protein